MAMLDVKAVLIILIILVAAGLFVMWLSRSCSTEHYDSVGDQCFEQCRAAQILAEPKSGGLRPTQPQAVEGINDCVKRCNANTANTADQPKKQGGCASCA